MRYKIYTDEELYWNLTRQITHINLYYRFSKKWCHVANTLTDQGCKGAHEVWCFVNNATRALNYKAIGFQYPRSREAYKECKDYLSYRKMIALADKLEDLGYINVYVGGLVRWEAKSRISSFITFNQKLIDLIGEDVSGEVDINDDCVMIRDRTTRDNKKTKGVSGIAPIRDNMKKYNKFIRSVDIAVDDVHLPSQAYRRLFIDDLKHGGRIYNRFGGIQSMSQHDRKKIVINGEESVELDFKAMHPSLLYEKKFNSENRDEVEDWLRENKGVYDPYFVDFPFDVDQEKIDWYKKEISPSYNPTRNLIKSTLMVCLNGKGFVSCYRAVMEKIANDVYFEEKGDLVACKYYGINLNGKFPTNILCETVQAYNYPIAEFFYSDVGIDLQMLDSRIMANVINQLTYDAEPVYPVHDSLIVRVSVKDKVKEMMRESYKQVMGNDKFCVIAEK